MCSIRQHDAFIEYKPINRTMMKKTNHHKVWSGLIACLLIVTSWMCSGCSDEYDHPEGTVLPKGELAKPFKVTRLKGVLKFDDEEQKWVIHPKNVAYPFESTSNFGHNVIYISNMNDKYKSLEGDVVFSGIVKRLYTFSHAHICTVIGYFKIELSELLPDETDSQTSSDE